MVKLTWCAETSPTPAGESIGNINSLSVIGPQSHSPASAKDSRVTCSEFTETLNKCVCVCVCCTSLHLMYALIVGCTSWNLMYALSVCLYVLPLKNST